MKKILLTMLLMALSNFAISAQERLTQDQKDQKNEIAKEVKDARNEFKGLKQDSMNAAKPNAEAPTRAVTTADVGEPDSFGKNVKFLGTAVTGFVLIYYSCDPTVLATDGIVLGVDDRCMEVSNPLIATTATFNDIGRIKLPAKSADNVIYYVANHLINYSIFNSNATPALGRVTYSPGITIESEALLDPTAIDPNTGLPMNGSYTTGIGSKTFNRTFQPNESDFVLDRYSLAATRGLARGFFADLGLPNNVINQLYKKPMTIKLNVRVSTRLVNDGQVFFSMRFMGN
jgi:hypothetical protein